MSIIELKEHLVQKIKNADLSISQVQDLEKNIDSFLIKTKSQDSLKERPFGLLKGMLVHMSDDFDEPLEDFKDYM